ncbi:MAG: TRAP transporter small permease [Clostridiales bacterium]|nr:TRAP transporter small permease [Clostridiales bacterium]
MKERLRKMDRAFINLQNNVCAIIFFIIFFLCLLQILFRNVIYVRAPWTEEFARVGLIYLTFFGAAIGIRMRAHPSADFITKHLSLRVRMLVGIVGELLVIAMSLVFVISGYQYVLRMVNDHSTTYYYSKSVWYYCIPISGLIMTGYGVRSIIYQVLSIIKKEDLTKEADSVE